MIGREVARGECLFIHKVSWCSPQDFTLHPTENIKRISSQQTDRHRHTKTETDRYRETDRQTQEKRQHRKETQSHTHKARHSYGVPPGPYQYEMKKKKMIWPLKHSLIVSLGPQKVKKVEKIDTVRRALSAT